MLFRSCMTVKPFKQYMHIELNDHKFDIKVLVGLQLDYYLRLIKSLLWCSSQPLLHHFEGRTALHNQVLKKILRYSKVIAAGVPCFRFALPFPLCVCSFGAFWVSCLILCPYCVALLGLLCCFSLRFLFFVILPGRVSAFKRVGQCAVLFPYVWLRRLCKPHRA